MMKNTTQQGHRQRLRDRFVRDGLNGFLDYEIVELLLTLGTPRRDCKQQAKALINHFGGLRQVLNAPVSELQKITGVGPVNSLCISLYKSLFARYSREKIEDRATLSSPSLIYEFLKEKIGNKRKEHFAVLFLDTQSKLVCENVSIGTLNGSLVHPREVFSRAITAHVSHIVIAHNHPSGDPTPSKQDIATTMRLVEAGKVVGISIVDHIIVTSNKYVSLRKFCTI